MLLLNTAAYLSTPCKCFFSDFDSFQILSWQFFVKENLLLTATDFEPRSSDTAAKRDYAVRRTIRHNQEVTMALWLEQAEKLIARSLNSISSLRRIRSGLSSLQWRAMI